MKRLLLCLPLMFGCQPVDGGASVIGPAGPPGPQGEQGPPGPMGSPGSAGGDASKSGTRLKVREVTSRLRGDDGAWAVMGAPVLSFEDTKLNVACEPAVAEDGITRCLPVDGGAGVVDYFSDSACSKGMVVQNIPDANPCAAPLPPPPKFLRQNVAAPQCVAAVVAIRVSSVGAEIARPGTIYNFDKDLMRCRGVNNFYPSKSRFFEVGSILRPTEFVGLIAERSIVDR